MSKVGIMMTADRAEQPMSEHFGKAEWMMVADTESQAVEFIKNDGLNGKGAAEIAIRSGVSDLVFAEIGFGAFGHLKAAGILGWVAPGPITGAEALQMFEKQQLQPAGASTTEAGHGCCCSSRAGAEASSCCRG